MTQSSLCSHCDGQGYIEIRDCSGEIQREETCSFCQGTGILLDELPQTFQEPEVNLCVKVPKSLRQHWAAEAKRRGTTMTSVIIEALSDRFGKPD